MSIKTERLILLQGIFDEATIERLKKMGVRKVFMLEGRPTLEAAQEMVNALSARGITPVLISDNMAGFLFARRMVREVWIPYQMVDQQGAVCRIGSLILAVLGKKHRVPVYLFKSGVKLRFMGRSRDLFSFLGERVAPRGVRAYVPQVEWVPRKYISKRYE